MRTFEQICMRYGLTKERVENEEVLDDHDLYHDLFVLWSHEMPYGTMKARTGDPSRWMYDRLCEEFGI